MLKIVDNEVGREEGYMLDELAREGARRMLMRALEEEVAAYVERHAEARDADGRRLVVRNGQARARGITCGAGTLDVRAPRVNDRRVDEEGERCRFMSRLLPPYMRRSPKVAEVLPVLYLRGLSTGDFRPALETLLGEEAAGVGDEYRAADRGLGGGVPAVSQAQPEG
jgi:putative transposase